MTGPTSSTVFYGSSSQRKKFVILIFLTALCARLLFLSFAGPQTGGDTNDYLLLSHNLRAQGAFSMDEQTLTPSIRRPPLYPSFLALLELLSGGYSPRLICLVQILLDSFVAVLVLLLTLMIAPVRFGVGAGLMYALNPALIVNSSTILTESFFISFLTSAIFLIALGIKRSNIRLMACGGALLGLATLCRPLIILLPIIFVALLFLMPKFEDKKRYAIVLLASFSLIVLPWTIRCSYHAGSLVTVQGLSTANFYLAILSDRNQTDEASLWAYFFGKGGQLPEDPYGRMTVTARTAAETVEADRFAFRQGIQNIKTNPKRYVTSRMKSYPYLFLNSFDRFTGIKQSYGQLFRQREILLLFAKLFLLFFFSALPFLLAVLGLARVRHDSTAMMCAAVWLFTLIVHLPMWVEFRFWLPAIPFQLVSAFSGLAFLQTKLSQVLNKANNNG